MKGNRKTQFAVAALAVVAALMLGIWYFAKPQPQAGSKSVTVEVVHASGDSREFPFRTDALFLGELLTSEGLAEGEQSSFGLFITTVDGETAQESLRQWWCITRDGQRVDTGADTTPIADGDHFELTLSTY